MSGFPYLRLRARLVSRELLIALMVTESVTSDEKRKGLSKMD